jgi:hypothetical protein
MRHPCRDAADRPIVVIKVGTLDEPGQMMPQVAIYTVDKSHSTSSRKDCRRSSGCRSGRAKVLRRRAGLDPATHVFLQVGGKDVDARHVPEGMPAFERLPQR